MIFVPTISPAIRKGFKKFHSFSVAAKRRIFFALSRQVRLKSLATFSVKALGGGHLFCLPARASVAPVKNKWPSNHRGDQPCIFRQDFSHGPDGSKTPEHHSPVNRAVPQSSRHKRSSPLLLLIGAIRKREVLAI